MSRVKKYLFGYKGEKSGINMALSKGVAVAAQEGGGSSSVMTPLGLMTGEILIHLESFGTTTVRKLNHVLKAPTLLVTMGVGALIRSGLVRGSRHGKEILVELS